MNVYLDPDRLTPALHRLAALGAAAGAVPSDVVSRRMDQLSRMCAGYASAAALDARGAATDDELRWLRNELRAVTAAAVERARALGAVDLAEAAEISATAQGAA